MSVTYVEKSVKINAPIDQIEEVLTDFNQWISWSPWLIMEPEAVVTVADDKQFYDWKGNRVGSGNMQFAGAEDTHDGGRLLRYELNFLSPWKSYADVDFKLKPHGDTHVHVDWIMRSSLPFFLFWMKNSIQDFIGMDYVRGLSMLKEQIETSSISSNLNFVGETSFNGTKYIGIKTTAKLSDMKTSMPKDFTRLGEYMAEHKGLQNGQPFSIYHNMDMSKQICTYTAAIPVSEVPIDLPKDIFLDDFPDTKMFCLRHEGKYEHLGNAWSTLHSMQRNKEFAPNKSIKPIERYINDPTEVAPEALVTDVMFAIK